MPSYPHRGPASHAGGDRAELGPVNVVGDFGTPARRSWLSSPAPKPLPLRLRLRLQQLQRRETALGAPRQPSLPPHSQTLRHPQHTPPPPDQTDQEHTENTHTHTHTPRP